MSPHLSTLLWGFVLTILASILEIKHRAKCGVPAVANIHSFFFLLIQLVGNSLSSLFAYYLIHTKTPLPDEFGFFEPFIAAVAGVFMFEVVFSNTNISVFDTGILRFQEWVELARVPAVAKSLELEAEAEMKTKLELVEQLQTRCSEEEINVHLQLAFKGHGPKLRALEAKSLLYKCLTLVEADKTTTKALVATHTKPTK